ncbi:sensor histidine kinase [Cloacibacterium sp.]|uniref:sensor histidine kinase n=1 Tax=Cloacibacterium sp. TaxID=1913682 RepID=UPI0039E6EF65
MKIYIYEFFTKKRLLIWITSFFIFYSFSFLINPFDEYWETYQYKGWIFIIKNELSALIICILICEVSLFIDRLLNSIIEWNVNPKKRLFIQILLQILSSILFVVFFNIIFLNTFEELLNTKQYKEYAWLSQWVVTNIIISIVISAINTGDFLLNNWKKSIMQINQYELRASHLKQAKMEAELQALKLQIDPHFVFNNLSVLSELILEDQQLGYEYAENFTKVYRYLLVNSKKDIISLDEELKFLDSYIFLTKRRIGDGVVFTISIEDKYRNFSVPPLTLQLLVENAIKHNQTTKANPLFINITTSSAKELLVSNTFLPLINKPESSGLGMNNVFNRYELLGDVKPQIEQSEDWYTVKIPLL